MLLTLAAGVVCFLIRQHVVERARFKVLETVLEVNDGYVNGNLSFRCSRFDSESGYVEYSDTLLHIENLADTRMVELKEGTEIVLDYRHRDFGPLARENPNVQFMVRKLGISKDEIVGFVQLDGWVEVVIRGKKRG